VDRSAVSRAVADAVAVVDEVLPPGPADGPPFRTAADQAALRAGALQAVVAQLLPTGSGAVPSDDLVRPSEAARMLNVRDTALHALERQGALDAVLTAGGHRRYRAGQVRELMDRDTRQLAAGRPEHDADTLEIVRMRVVERLSWNDIGAKSGMSGPAAQMRFSRWVYRQYTAAVTPPAETETGELPGSPRPGEENPG
jgi:hypothetical protein